MRGIALLFALAAVACAPAEPAAEPHEVDALAVEDVARPDLGSPVLEGEMRAVRIEMYMTDWCPVCTRARGFLRARGYQVVEHDVDRDLDAAEAHRRLNPRGSVPTFDVEGLTLIGFAPGLLDRAVVIAALRRIEQRQSTRP